MRELLRTYKTRFNKGFTLIELLIVIAILGILTTAVLVSINPLEQFARGRDSGRLGAVDQLGHAVQSFYTSQDGVYLSTGGTWITSLQTAGELKTKPVNPTSAGYVVGCNTANLAESGYCYQVNAAGTDAIVYARAESNAQKVKAACGNNTETWLLWSSADGRSGLVCTGQGIDPVPGVLSPK